jgi:hypothetical protein
MKRYGRHEKRRRLASRESAGVCPLDKSPLIATGNAKIEEARAKVTTYVSMLFEAGEKDPHRLTVCGLTYLRELDGSSDPVKAGFTGL